jgi:hypothetical protein
MELTSLLYKQGDGDFYKIRNICTLYFVHIQKHTRTVLSYTSLTMYETFVLYNVFLFIAVTAVEYESSLYTHRYQDL